MVIYALAQDKVIQVAFAIAIGLHALLIFGLSFVNGTTPAAMMQEVVDVMSTENQPNKNADYLAANSQKGSGDATDKQKLQSPDSSPLTSNEMNITLDIENTEKKQTAQQYMTRYLRTTLSIEKINKDSNKKEENKKHNNSEADDTRIMAQIATLEAQFSRRQQTLSKKTKVETRTSAMDTKQDATANYIGRFKKRVEQIGNAHYPEVARAKNITGDVRLMVILSPEGEVKAIRLLQSSGSRLLDKYAKATVRQAAPFGKFDKDMGVSELRLIRTWEFANVITVTE